MSNIVLHCTIFTSYKTLHSLESNAMQGDFLHVPTILIISKCYISSKCSYDLTFM